MVWSHQLRSWFPAGSVTLEYPYNNLLGSRSFGGEKHIIGLKRKAVYTPFSNFSKPLPPFSPPRADIKLQSHLSNFGGGRC